MIFINGIFLTQKITGVQRFATEITKRLINNFTNYKLIVPKNTNITFDVKDKSQLIYLTDSGSKELWEQYYLRKFLFSIGNPLLLNFTGLGPIFYPNNINTIHDISFLIEPNWFSKKYFYIYKFLTPLVVKTAKHIFTVSNYSKNELLKYYNIDKNKVSVIYNSVDFIKKRSTVKSKENIILTVGSLSRRKNIQTLIQAFGDWSKAGYKLVVVGGEDKNLNNNIDEKVTNIIFTGYISDKKLKQWYKKADIFVFPSLYEGFGIPPLEAMAHGVPVISSNRASLPEVCGDAALYIDPLKPRKIKDALEKLSGNEYLQKKLVDLGFKNLERFSWKKSADVINSLVKKIN